MIDGLARAGLELIDAERCAALRETLWCWLDGLGRTRRLPRGGRRGEFRVWRVPRGRRTPERGWLSLWQLLAGKPLPDGEVPHPLTRLYVRPEGD